MQSSVPEVNCRGGPPVKGTSQICHGSPARCLPLNKTDWASGDKAGSADVAREGASGRETPLANTFTAAPAGNRSPAWSAAWTSYRGASVYRNAPDIAAAPTGRHKESSSRSPTRPPESDFHTLFPAIISRGCYRDEY